MKDPLTLDQLIDIANAAYPDGMIRLYYQQPEIDHGDALAKFIVSEITEAHSYGGGLTWQEMSIRHAMGRAASEVRSVATALDNALNP